MQKPKPGKAKPESRQLPGAGARCPSHKSYYSTRDGKKSSAARERQRVRLAIVVGIVCAIDLTHGVARSAKPSRKFYHRARTT